MEKKYHLTDDGPKPCTATIRQCPIGGEHFTSLESAWNSYDATRKTFATMNKRAKRPKMSSETKTNIAFGAIAATLAVGFVGGLAANTQATENEHRHNVEEANKTPYSVSIDHHGASHEYKFTGTVVDSNLKKTNFQNCVNSNPKGIETTITCKSPDGKYSVKVDVRYSTFKQRHMKVKDSELIVKTNNGNKKITDFKSNSNYSNLILTPQSIVK